MTQTPIETVKQSVKLLPDQIQSAWEAIQVNPLPQQFHEAEQVVVTGMGGSALGGRILKSYAEQQIPVPVEVVTNYTLPEYVNEKTLVIAISYSGNTEETITALREALDKKAMIFVITTGGKLKEIAIDQGLASYIIEPEHNPSNQPRMATGYFIGAIFSLLSSIKLVAIADGEMHAALDTLKGYITRFEVEEAENHAFDIAQKIENKLPVLVASEHLLGPVHVMKNQLNETSKSFAVQFDLPELNHHLMEGLSHPEFINEFVFILFESELYHPQIQKRYPITKDVLDKNNINSVSYRCEAESRLVQIFEVLALGSFVQVYLAKQYGSDPTSIPWVDYFKQELAK